MLDELKNQLTEYEIRTITKLNFAQAFEVYNTNQDFFRLTEGKNATIESSISDIEAVPPNFDIEQKIYVSIWKDSKVLCVLDLLQDYPTQTCVYIGLLMIHGDFHGRKIGSTILTAVLNAARIFGHKSIQLGVIENNTSGISFWLSHGFDKIKTAKNIVVMGKKI